MEALDFDYRGSGRESNDGAKGRVKLERPKLRKHKGYGLYDGRYSRLTAPFLVMLVPFAVWLSIAIIAVTSHAWGYVIGFGIGTFLVFCVFYWMIPPEGINLKHYDPPTKDDELGAIDAEIASLKKLLQDVEARKTAILGKS